MAASHSPVPIGDPAAAPRLVPVFSVTHRTLAAIPKQCLIQAGIAVQTRHERLSTRFLVASDDLPAAMEIREVLLTEQPDTPRGNFSRDFDGTFLLTPFVILTSVIAYCSTEVPNYAWVGVLTSGLTAMLVLERLHQQFRRQLRSQWGIQDMLWGTAAVAANVVLWKSIL